MASTAAKGPVPRFYKALGVKQDATGKEIRKAYRALAITRHPDKISTGQSTPEERESARRDFVELAKAYEVLSDGVGRKRYDYWTSEQGAEAAYPDGSFDWSLIDQQLGLASMQHRDTSGATEAAGSRVWSMEEAEQLFRETEILSKREHDDDDGDEDSNATVNLLAMLGLGVTTAASILIPLYISWNRTRAKHDEKARKKQPTAEQKAELAARRAAVSRREAEEQAQKRVRDEEKKKSMKKKKGEKERGGGEEEEDDNRRQKTWPRFDDTDPFLRRIQWIERLTYEGLLASLHPHAAAEDVTQASAAADVLTKFQSHLGEDAYEGVAYGLMSVVLEAHSTKARGVDVAALEELVGRWLDAESPVRVKLDDKWERVLKDSVSALVAMDEDDDGADEADDADEDEEKRQAFESAVADALDKLSAAALDRLKQGGGKLKGIKEQWASFWSSEEGHRTRETAVQLDDVLESDVATNAFAEHLEFEGGGGDLELYFELSAATDAEDAEQRKEAALGMLDRFFSEDAEGPLPSVAEDLEGIAEDLRALVEEEDDDREEEEDDEDEEELVVPLLQDMLAHTHESLVESLASFASHTYRPMGGGKAEKSKVYGRLLKAAHAVVGSGSATQGGSGEYVKRAQGDVGKPVEDVKSAGGGRVVKGGVVEEEEEEEDGMRGGKAKGGGGRGKGGKVRRKA